MKEFKSRDYLGEGKHQKGSKEICVPGVKSEGGEQN